MRNRSIAAASVAMAALLSPVAAQASTVTLAFDASQSGPHQRLDDHTYYVPRDTASTLTGTLLDDTGTGGASCMRTATRTMAEPDFGHDAGISCPSSESGRWSWLVYPGENQQFRAAVVPDEANAAAESEVITLLTSPEVHWQTGWDSRSQYLEVLVGGDNHDYAGTVTVRQGARVVGSGHVSGTDGRLIVRASRKRKARLLTLGKAFTVTLTPDDRSRWVAMRASGRMVASRVGDAGPVL